MIITDSDFCITYMNPAAEEMYGFTLEEVEGKTPRIFNAEPESEKIQEEIFEKVSEMKTYEDVLLNKRKDGSKFYCEMKISPVFEENIEGYVGFHRDVSERIKKEKERKKAEEEQELLLETMEDHVWYLKDAETYGKVNQSHADFLGLDKSEIENKNIHEIVSSKKESEKFIEGNRKVFEIKETVETEEWVKNDEGEERLLSITRTPKIVDRKIQYIVCSARDVTERTVADKKIKYSHLVENLSEIVYILNENAEIKYISPNVEERSGYSISELKEKGFIEFVHPDDMEERLENFRKVLNGNSEPSEYRYITKDGEVVWVRTHARPIRKDGGVVGVQGVLSDITKRKKIEEREEFIYSILRHDMDNKHQIVRGYLELLKDSDLSDENKSLVEKAEKAINESSRIIEKTRELKRISDEKAISETYLESVLEVILSDHQDQLESIEVGLDVSDYIVKGGPLLEALFSNLINNSIQHSGCEKIKITTESIGDEILCTVEDDGIGIKDEDKDKIFERGFKKGHNGGSGLGMYIVKKIAESYDASIELKDSELGGARFDIHLKRV